MRRRIASLALLLLLCATPTVAQQVMVDQGIRVGGLWCFPSATNPDHWYYVPLTARLATGDNGKPVFSFLQYVSNAPSETSSTQGITQASGGGIVTLMATYDTPQDVIRAAEGELQSRENGDEAELRGPIIFKEGRYVLISSILREQDAEGKRVLATGNAPVFEGNEVAFSFDVTAEQSTLLRESFQMDTPDVSIVFEMTATGLSDAFDAVLTVDWSKVHSNETLAAGASVLGGLGAADIEKGFEELRNEEAIQIVTRGANPNMEKLLDKVNQKLMTMMFKRVEPEKAAAQGEEQPAGLLDSLFGPIAETMSDPGALSRMFSYAGASVNYERKEIRQSGQTTIHLNSQAPVDRYITMAANIGDLYKRFGRDSNVFRTVNLADPAYQQREIHVGIDGAILPEFEKYINSVTVTLRKKHQNGAQTLQEIVVDANTFNRESRNFKMIYGWNGDSDRNAWLGYDYRTRWSFKGGGLHETNWSRTTTNMIDLYAPYRRNTVELIGDAELLKEHGVRAVSVSVEYDFFEGRRSQEVALHNLDEVDGKELEITLPLNVYDYDYSVTWIRRGKPPLTRSGSDDTGVIFVDDLPPEDGDEA